MNSWIKPPSDSSPGSPALDRVGLVVLAAGQSMRMGRPKALIELEGRPLLEHVLAASMLDELGDVVVVLGHPCEAARPVVGRCHRRHVVNPYPARGRLGSVQKGLGALGPGIRAAFVQPIDCPLVVPAVYRTLAVRLGEAHVAVPTYGGEGGHPPLVAAKLFGRILAAEPDEPLRNIFRAPGVTRCTIEVDDPGVLLNVDSPEDLAGLSALYAVYRERLGEV